MKTITVILWPTDLGRKTAIKTVGFPASDPWEAESRVNERFDKLLAFTTHGSDTSVVESRLRDVVQVFVNGLNTYQKARIGCFHGSTLKFASNAVMVLEFDYDDDTYADKYN